MNKSTLDSFQDVTLAGTHLVTGGCKPVCAPDPKCPPAKVKGNNGIGNGLDPAPPGLVANGKNDFNDSPSNRHE